MQNSFQHSFVFKTHGGVRKGAGRPKIKANEPSHTVRPMITKRIPFHGGLKLHPQAPGLRNKTMFKSILTAFTKAKEKGLRITQFAIEENHIHFIAEADCKRDVTLGLMSVTASITWALRRLHGYLGKVFATRYFIHAIKFPREMYHALKYVLFNHAKHLKVDAFADVYSSACSYEDLPALLKGRPHFNPWSPEIRHAVSTAQSWLQVCGWKKARAATISTV